MICSRFHPSMAHFNSRSAPTQFVPLSEWSSLTCPLLAIRHRKTLMKEVVSKENATSWCTALIPKQVKMTPYLFTRLLPRWFQVWKDTLIHPPPFGDSSTWSPDICLLEYLCCTGQLHYIMFLFVLFCFVFVMFSEKNNYECSLATAATNSYLFLHKWQYIKSKSESDLSAGKSAICCWLMVPCSLRQIHLDKILLIATLAKRIQ